MNGKAIRPSIYPDPIELCGIGVNITEEANYALGPTAWTLDDYVCAYIKSPVSLRDSDPVSTVTTAGSSIVYPQVNRNTTKLKALSPTVGFKFPEKELPIALIAIIFLQTKLYAWSTAAF